MVLLLAPFLKEREIQIRKKFWIVRGLIKKLCYLLTQFMWYFLTNKTKSLGCEFGGYSIGSWGNLTQRFYTTDFLKEFIITLKKVLKKCILEFKTKLDRPRLPEKTLIFLLGFPIKSHILNNVLFYHFCGFLFFQVVY